MVYSLTLSTILRAVRFVWEFSQAAIGRYWTTHGLADVILFIMLGLIFLKTNVAEKINPHRLISILVWAVIAARLGLFAWFLFF
jgi:uncharacterized membrane protein SirB2